MLDFRRQRRQLGGVVAIPLDENEFAFGRILAKPLIAFYDFKTDQVPPIQDVLQKPILFKIWVMSSAITRGRWPIVGISPLEDKLLESPYFFKSDPISKELSIYRDGKEVPATYEECVGLECAAVWSAHHVEDRLRDHFKGGKNMWAESLQIR